MKRISSGVLILVCGLLLLGGCGGKQEAEEVIATPAPKAASKANNPLASQQALIQDAKGVQAILDADAEKKKKALENSN